MQTILIQGDTFEQRAMRGDWSGQGSGSDQPQNSW